MLASSVWLAFIPCLGRTAPVRRSRSDASHQDLWPWAGENMALHCKGLLSSIQHWTENGGPNLIKRFVMRKILKSIYYSFGEDFFFAMVTLIQLLMVISADLCPRLSKCTFFYTSSNFGDITLPKNVHKVWQKCIYNKKGIRVIFNNAKRTFGHKKSIQ